MDTPQSTLDPPKGPNALTKMDDSRQIPLISEAPILATVTGESAAADLQVASASDSGSRSIFRRIVRFCWTGMIGCFRLLSLVVLLAILTAIPILQLIALGYMLDVAGRLTKGLSLSDALSHRTEAGKIGLAMVAILVASLPTQLLVHWESVAQLIDPDSAQASTLRLFAIASCIIAMLYLMWAWVRGGRWHHYLWPEPVRFLKQGWRWGTWRDAPDQLWDFTRSLQLTRFFWLGLRGFAGTLLWLLPAFVLIATNRNSTPQVAGVVGLICAGVLGIILLYLPMLQAHFAAENRLRSLFAVRTIRRDFRRAPWAWFLAMTISLVVMPIPLYLLKIEATPREVLWLPCFVFVAFILPARIAAGLALRRARRQQEPSGFRAGVSRWSVRLLMPAVVATYLGFLQISQYTSWDGLSTWIQQHAILIPVPFVGV